MKITEKDGTCEVCQTHIPAADVWNRIHIGEHRSIQKDICRICDEKGYLFYKGEVHAEPDFEASNAPPDYPLWSYEKRMPCYKVVLFSREVVTVHQDGSITNEPKKNEVRYQGRDIRKVHIEYKEFLARCDWSQELRLYKERRRVRFRDLFPQK